MIYMNKFKIIALLLMLNGALISFSSFSGITGLIVFEEAGSAVDSILGIIMFIGGIVLFLYDLEERAGGPPKIIKTKSFEKSLKNHKSELKRIENAIGKIGSGLANEEYLKHEKIWSIRTSHGGRIVYDKANGQVILQGYSPPSRHY